MQQVHPCTILREGFDSETNPEFVRFLRYAKRSCTEVQSELYEALDQQYITKAEFQEVYDHAGRTRAAIRGFIKYLLTYEKGQQKQANPEPGTHRIYLCLSKMDPCKPKFHRDSRKALDVSSLTRTIQEVVRNKPEVIFAYLYGSVVEGEDCRDIDIALYIAEVGADPVLLEVDIQTELSEKTGLPLDFFDVRVINKAPVDFAITVLKKGKLLFSCDEQLRSDYIERIASRYRKDFRIFEAI